MNQDEIESAFLLLKNLKWPKDESGYLMSSESHLPPYRILSKMLRERQIDQQMTWNKAQCIEALGGIENVKEYVKNEQNFISENLTAIVMSELMTQKELNDKIMECVQGEPGTLLQIIDNEENQHIEQQQQMFS